MSMGVIPVNMQSASLDVVRNAFAIRTLMRRCTRMYFCLFWSKFIASIHTGAPYVSRGRIAPLYIVSIASCLILHVNFAPFDKLRISFAIFSAVYVMYSWNLNLWSRIIPKYFIWVTCSKGLLFKYTVMFLFSLRFILETSNTLDLVSLNLILLFFAHPFTLLGSTFV